MNDYSANAPDISDYSFPHMNDTQFPLLENVDVYKYENEFDYERWTDTTKIYLCNVLWNNDYKDVVKFVDDAARDAWFDSIDSYKVELTTAFHVTPNGNVKVPVPYDVATRYNYLYVDLPVMTSADNPINYESDRRTQRYYYFIDGISQQSPNATMLLVSPDNWTTFINNVDIPYLMLERGHAPMASIDVETYLDNPIANNSLLLAPDFNFSDDVGIVRTSHFAPINNGDKYIIFASVMSTEQITQQVYPQKFSSVNTPATFANADARDGYQYIVNDYEWNIGDYDYSDMFTESTAYQSGTQTVPTMSMIAVPANYAKTMFDYMNTVIPFFFKTIKAIFVVDDSMFEKGDSFEFCSVTCYKVKPAADSILQVVNFNKEDFKYDEKYANITKLYTSPYAMIEVTDNAGNVKRFKIENSVNVDVRMATALAFPYISIQAYLTGVNGSGYSEYAWAKLDETSDIRKMYADDFGDYLWEMEIPTYALFVRGYDEYKASNYPNQEIQRYNAVADYQKTVGMDNTQYENAKDAADNTQTMTNNSADTEYNNETAASGTIQTNNNASASTGQSNANASANTMNTNANNTANNMVANTALDVARNSANLATDLNAQYTATSYGNLLNIANQRWDAGLTNANTDAKNAQIMATGVANTVGSITSGVGNVMGNLGSGNVLGAIGAAVSAAGDVASAGITTVVSCATNTTIANNTNANTEAKVAELNNNNLDNYNIQNTNRNTQTTQNNTTATSQTANTSNLTKTNAGNTSATEKANAQRSYDTSVANNGRTYNTSVANAGRTRDTSKGNATLNRNLAVANSGYTRERAVQNAKIGLEQKRLANQQSYNSQRLNDPVQYGAYSGNPMLDAYERRGMQIKYRTQSDGHIAQAGDLMLRYGYALNQIWDMRNASLTQMAHFTYWKASEIWINEGKGVNQDAQGDIQRAFENGVTVWSDPNEVGKVSIYDNWK